MDLQKLVAIFERAQSGASPGDEYAGNPLKWPVVRGVKAVADEYEARIKDLEGALEELLLAFEFERGRISQPSISGGTAIVQARSAFTGRE